MDYFNKYIIYIFLFYCKDQREQRRNEFTRRSQDLDAAFNE